jgi:hypothetical protein
MWCVVGYWCSNNTSRVCQRRPIRHNDSKLLIMHVFSNQSFGASKLPYGEVGGFIAWWGFFSPQINSCSAMNHCQIISVSTVFYPLLPSIIAFSTIRAMVRMTKSRLESRLNWDTRHSKGCSEKGKRVLAFARSWWLEAGRGGSNERGKVENRSDTPQRPNVHYSTTGQTQIKFIIVRDNRPTFPSQSVAFESACHVSAIARYFCFMAHSSLKAKGDSSIPAAHTLLRMRSGSGYVEARPLSS